MASCSRACFQFVVTWPSTRRPGARPCDWPDCAASANPSLSLSARRFLDLTTMRRGSVVRSIGMDVHRCFAQIAVVEDGLCRDEGRIGVRPEDLRAWAATLEPTDEV